MRRAFRARGHDAWSCDLKPAEDDSPHHFQGDVFDYLGDGPGFSHANPYHWDLAIFHWDCTYLANSGAKHLYIGMKKENGPCPERWQKMREAATNFRRLQRCGVPHIAMENPIMHMHGRALIDPWPRHITHPWEHGHREMKATCWWLKNLPPLEPTDIVGPPPTDPEERKHWAKVHRMAPGPNRKADRARTLHGLGQAAAKQWGDYVLGNPARPADKEA